MIPLNRVNIQLLLFEELLRPTAAYLAGLRLQQDVGWSRNNNCHLLGIERCPRAISLLEETAHRNLTWRQHIVFSRKLDAKVCQAICRPCTVLKVVVHILSVVNARHDIEQFVAVSTVTQGEQKGSRIRSSPCSKPHAFDKQVLNRYVGL